MRPDAGVGGSTRPIAGRYQPGEVLGRGGMGEVRAGRDLRLGRQVAIKVLRAEMAGQPEIARRFEEEARAAASLNHPNVVAVFDAGDHDGVPYLVMERLPGRTLADELAESDGPLDAARVRQLAGDVLAALGAAHRAGIVHRDVKPGNVLLCPDGSAKVADFGIAKSVEAADLTTTGAVVGTPSYIAPERLAGEPATARSDLYSAGVLLYEALSGQLPFPGESPAAVVEAVQNQQPTPLAALRPDLPPALVAAVERAIDKDPGRRFATAAEMAEAVTPVEAAAAPTTVEIVAPEGAAATQALNVTQELDPVTPVYAPAVAARRRWLPLVLIGAVALAALGFAAWRDSGGAPSPSDGVQVEQPALPPTTLAPATAPTTSAPATPTTVAPAASEPPASDTGARTDQGPEKSGGKKGGGKKG